MRIRTLRLASLLGSLALVTGCGVIPEGEAGSGPLPQPASTGTTGTLVDSATSGTTGAQDTGATTGGTAGTTTSGDTSGTTTAGTTAGTTGGTGTATAGSTGGATAGTVTGGGNACTPDGWDNYAAAKFSTWCANCHALGFSTLAAVKNDQTAIESRLKSKNMPKGKTLDTDTYNRLIKWIDCGLPQ